MPRNSTRVPAGYAGPLYAEISPRTFPILARTGSRLSQIRFRQGEVRATDEVIHALHAEKPLVTSGTVDIDNGIALTIDLSSFGDGQPVGFRAKRHSGLVDVDRKAALEVLDYWDPIWQRDRADPRSRPVLHPGVARRRCACRPPMPLK